MVTQTKPAEKRIIAFFLVTLFLCAQALSCEKSPSVQIPAPGLGLLIQKRITEVIPLSKKFIGGEQIYAALLTESFYKERNYEPAWSQDGHLIQAEALIMAVEEAYGDGLTPDYYHLGLIRSLVDKVKKEVSPDPIYSSQMHF
jgi:hypothetical protein